VPRFLGEPHEKGKRGGASIRQASELASREATYIGLYYETSSAMSGYPHSRLKNLRYLSILSLKT